MVPFILWSWLGTFVVSCGYDFYNSLNVVKIAADRGYKVNVERIRNFAQMTNDMFKVSVLTYFIPGVNIFITFKKAMLMDDLIDTVIKEFLVMGVLEDMTELDIEEYQKKPSIKSALDIPIKSMKLQFEKNNNTMNDIEEKLRTIEKEVKETRVKDIEELKKLREEILELSKSDSIPLQKISDIFLKDLEEIESIDVSENIEDGPKLEKKL